MSGERNMFCVPTLYLNDFLQPERVVGKYFSLYNHICHFYIFKKFINYLLFKLSQLFSRQN